MKTKLGSLTRIRTGKLDANAAVDGGQYPFFTCAKEPLAIASYSYDCECVLVAGNGDLNVKYYNGKFDAYQRTYIIENNDDILYMPYLYYFMNYYIDELRRQSIGGIIKYIRLGNLTGAEIDLPSQTEQKEIVNHLSSLSSLIDMRNDELIKLDALVKSEFVEMFEGKKWPRRPMGELATIVDPQPSHRAPKAVVNGVPYIGIADCDYAQKRINFEDARIVDASVLEEHKARYTLDTGDFIIGKIGTIGKPFFVQLPQEYTLSANTLLIQPNRELVNPQFLLSAFQTEDTNRQILKLIGGSSQPAFGIGKTRKLMFTVPPLSQQQEFAVFVAQVDKSEFAVRQSIEQLELLKAKLMQEYFG